MEPSRPAVVVALVTPFRDDGKVEPAALAEHVDEIRDELEHPAATVGLG